MNVYIKFHTRIYHDDDDDARGLSVHIILTMK
jgi:hypothetical protein